MYVRSAVSAERLQTGNPAYSRVRLSNCRSISCRVTQVIIITQLLAYNCVYFMFCSNQWMVLPSYRTDSNRPIIQMYRYRYLGTADDGHSMSPRGDTHLCDTRNAIMLAYHLAWRGATIT